MWNPFNRLHKRQIEHRPAPDPRRRASRPAVTTQQTHRSVHLNLSIFNFHRWGATKAPRPPSQPGRSLLDLKLLNGLFGPRPPTPPSVARVRAANRRADQARERTAARTTVKRQPPPASRPANRADQAELRRLQRERAAHEAQQQKQQQAQAAPTVVEGVKVSDVAAKPVKVRGHKRAGVQVDSYVRSAPESED